MGETPVVARPKQHLLQRRKSWDAGASVSSTPSNGEEGTYSGMKMIRRRRSVDSTALRQTSSLRTPPMSPREEVQERNTFSAGEMTSSLWEPRSSLRRRNLAQNLGVLSPPDNLLNTPRSGTSALAASEASTGCSSPRLLDISHVREPQRFWREPPKSKSDEILAKMNAYRGGIDGPPIPLEAETRRLSHSDNFDGATKRIAEKLELLQAGIENVTVVKDSSAEMPAEFSDLLAMRIGSNHKK